MSCDKCDSIQDGASGIGGLHAYVRVGKANVMIVGCEEHLRELIDKLRFADAAGWQGQPQRAGKLGDGTHE